MIQTNATLVLDLGNSGTRCGVTVFTEGGTQKVSRIMSLSNRFAQLPGGYVIAPHYISANSTALIVDEDADRGIVGGSVIANGELAYKEFEGSIERPTAEDKKYLNKFSKFSLQLAVLHAYRAIGDILGVTDLSELDITWKVVCLLPPGDLAVGKKPLQDMVRSCKSFSYKHPDVILPFQVDKVGVFSEGFCAFMGVVYDDTYHIRAGYEGVVKDITLIVDIGAGTTDIIIVQEGKPMEASMFTVTAGGNNVTARIRNAAKNSLGFKITQQDIVDAMETGYIKFGSSYKDITGIIKKEKESFAQSIVSEVIEFFEGISYPIQRIGKVLVVGGGALDSNDGDVTRRTGTMTEGVVSFMKKHSPAVEIVSLPEVELIEIDAEGKTTKTTKKASPRILNLLGGMVIANNA